MRCFLLICCFACLQFKSQAGGGPDYRVSAIPAELLKNAHAVVREQEVTVDIRSAGKYLVKEKMAITILDEAADDQASWSDYYSKLRSIEYVEGTLYDALGNKIRSLKKSEIKDFPLYDGISLANDDRVRSHSFYHKTYPYTVVYESEISSSLTMFLPMWMPVNSKGLSVEKSRFIISFDKDMTVHRKVFNYSREPLASSDGKRNNWTWELLGHPAYLSEYAAPSIYDLAPFAQFTMGSFKMEDFPGSLNSWQEYGAFIAHMREGLDVLPPDVKNRVKELTQSAGTTEQKVQILYDYLQKHSHYISVQIGIGGWRPFPASYVASKGYGDCKALSNFMVAMLKEAGIKSYYTLVNAGKGKKDINPDFPSPYFNHVICAVPVGKDTIWLECTSQTNSLGYAGSFTGNRHALLITEEGGKIAATPRYGKKENVQISRLQGKLLDDGTLQMQADNHYYGESGETQQYIVNAYSKEEQLKYIKKALPIPSYDVSSFTLTEERSRLPVVNEKYTVTASHYGQITGKRIFLLPNITNRWDRKLPTDTARQYWINLTDDLTEIDSVNITVPAGYTLEAAIKPMQLTTVFGTYEVNATLAGNEVHYYRKLQLNRGRFEATQYNELAKFYDQLYKSDHSKMVLVKKE